jgi:hypothetical protein
MCHVTVLCVPQEGATAEEVALDAGQEQVLFLEIAKPFLKMVRGRAWYKI